MAGAYAGTGAGVGAEAACGCSSGLFLSACSFTSFILITFTGDYFGGSGVLTGCFGAGTFLTSVLAPSGLYREVFSVSFATASVEFAAFG